MSVRRFVAKLISKSRTNMLQICSRATPQPPQQLTNLKIWRTASSLESVATSLYEKPELYEAAFGFRDFDAEVAFLVGLNHELSGRPATTFLELG